MCVAKGSLGYLGHVSDIVWKVLFVQVKQQVWDKYDELKKEERKKKSSRGQNINQADRNQKSIKKSIKITLLGKLRYITKKNEGLLVSNLELIFHIFFANFPLPLFFYLIFFFFSFFKRFGSIPPKGDSSFYHQNCLFILLLFIFSKWRMPFRMILNNIIWLISSDSAR